MALRKRITDQDALGAVSNVIDAQISQRKLGVNDILRARRQECGIELSSASRELRIRESILSAIEDGRFDLMPGPAYAVGFVRSYASYLGLEAEPLVIRFKAESAEIARRPHLSFPLPMNDSRVPTRSLLIICLLLAALTYSGWYYWSAGNAQLAEFAPSVPDRLRNLLSPAQIEKKAIAEGIENERTSPAPIAPEPDPSASAVAAPAGVRAIPSASLPPGAAIVAPPAADGVPPVEDKAAVSQAVSLPPAPDLAQPAIAADTAKQPPENTFGAPDSEARVVLRAVSDSWIQVRDRNSNLLFTRMLKSGHRGGWNQSSANRGAGPGGAERQPRSRPLARRPYERQLSLRPPAARASSAGLM
jgi:cytoskeleton protein RodZ